MRIFQVDAFTATRFTGNPAIVVLDADGQNETTLQSVAREFSHAEVAFVFAANAADHDVRLRFFNARKEAPFVGSRHRGSPRRASGLGQAHASVFAANIAASASSRSARKSSSEPRDAESVIEFRQTAPELDAPLPFKTTLRVAEALKLPATQLHDVMPARIARKGSSRLLVPIADPRHLEQLAPNFDTLMSLGQRTWNRRVLLVRRESRFR